MPVIKPALHHVTFKTNRLRTRAASRSRSYSPPSALGGFYRTRSPASACRFPSTRGPQQSDEQHADCNPKRDRLVARVIKLEVWL